MTSITQNQASNFHPPRIGYSARLTVTSTAQRWTVPEIWRGNAITIHPVDDIQIAFSKFDTDVLGNAALSTVSGAGTAGDPYTFDLATDGILLVDRDIGIVIPADTTIQLAVPTDAEVFLHAISVAASVLTDIYVSGP